jgi:hypothetical protein
VTLEKAHDLLLHQLVSQCPEVESVYEKWKSDPEWGLTSFCEEMKLKLTPEQKEICDALDEIEWMRNSFCYLKGVAEESREFKKALTDFLNVPTKEDVRHAIKYRHDNEAIEKGETI